MSIEKIQELIDTVSKIIPGQQAIADSGHPMPVKTGWGEFLKWLAAVGIALVIQAILALTFVTRAYDAVLFRIATLEHDDLISQTEIKELAKASETLTRIETSSNDFHSETEKRFDRLERGINTQK